MLMSKNGNERDETRNEIKEWDNKGNALAEEKRRKQNEKKALRSEENTLNQSKNELGTYVYLIIEIFWYKMANFEAFCMVKEVLLNS